MGSRRNVAISLFRAEPIVPPTAHFYARQTKYIAAGDARRRRKRRVHGDLRLLVLRQRSSMRSLARSGSDVALGDSITDAGMTTSNDNRRWPDDLARLFRGRFGFANAGHHRQRRPREQPVVRSMTAEADA
jgi:hypothetical protein